MSKFRGKSSLYVAIFGLLALVLPLNLAYRQTQAQATQGDQFVYLPLVVAGNEAATPPPPPSPVRKALFVEPDTRTANAAIAVDQQGNMHMAYSLAACGLRVQPSGAAPSRAGQ